MTNIHSKEHLQRMANHLLLMVDQSIESCVELRAIGYKTGKAKPATHNGFYPANPEGIAKLCVDAVRVAGSSKGCYFTINPLRPELLLKRNSKLEYSGRGDGASDADVIYRRWFYFDFDSITAVDGISASDDEKARSLEAANGVREFLTSRGWPDSILADSGNGYHLYYRINLPNVKESTELIKSVIRAISEQFTVPGAVKIDTGIFDAVRITKVLGTLARKGESPTKERPHRMPRPIDVPGELLEVPVEKLQEIAATASKQQSRPAPVGGPIHSRRTDRRDPFKRAESFIAKLPGAVTGHGGGDKTIDTVNEMVNGFGLSVDDAMSLLLKWNETCVPPWEERELLRKAEDVFSNGDNKGRPKGWRLNESAGNTPPLVYHSSNEFEPLADEASQEADPLADLGLKLDEMTGQASDASPSVEQPTATTKANQLHEIELGADQARVNDAAVAALATDPDVYRRHGILVHVIENESLESNRGIERDVGSPMIQNIPVALVRERLTRVARFYSIKKSKDGDIKEVDDHPPQWLVDAVYHRGYSPKFRELSGIATTPTLRPDGTIISRPGYDRQTGLLSFISCDLEIPENPSIDDAREAAETLFDVVCDFPFSQPEHKSSWLALTLTPFARHAFSGPSPLFLVDANVRGSGKSKLVDTSAIISTGRPAARMSNTASDEEMKKRITSLALGGDTFALIDNIVGDFGCPSLDAALTAELWKDRLLGVNKMVEMRLNITWAGTGNNVITVSDVARRVSHIRLKSMEVNPEERTGFRYPNLLQFVKGRRAEFVRSSLMILRAYFAAGCPDQSLKSWGSFEGWSDVVRNAIVWGGYADPGLTRDELAKQSDSAGEAHRELLRSWHLVDPTNEGLTTGKLLELLAKHFDRFEEVRSAVCELCGAAPGKLPSVRSLGNKLRYLRERIFDVGSQRMCLDSKVNRMKQQVWCVKFGAESAESEESISGRSANSYENVPDEAVLKFPHPHRFQTDTSDSADSALQQEFPDWDSQQSSFYP